MTTTLIRRIWSTCDCFSTPRVSFYFKIPGNMFVPWTEGEGRHCLGKRQLSDFTDIYRTSESQQSSGENSFGNYCKCTNSVPKADDIEQIFLFQNWSFLNWSSKLQNRLREEPVFPLVPTWWTSRTNSTRAKRESCICLQTINFLSRDYAYQIYIWRKVSGSTLLPTSI